MKYHISGLPPGYFIHLSKDGKVWETNFKSPHSREWKHWRWAKKGAATTAAIKWYNIQVAKPEVQELTPIQQMMISKGVSKRRFSIHRTEPTPNDFRYYVMGGSNNLEATQFAHIQGNAIKSINVALGEKPLDFVLPFLQGMIYLSLNIEGNIRSVNRYTKNPQAWIDSHHTWFRNMAKHKLSLHITRHKSSGTPGFTIFKINGTDFVRFRMGTTPKEGEKDYSKDYPNTHGMGEQEYYDPKESVWRTLRPTTQKNLLAKALKMGDGVKDLNRSKLTGRLFLLYVNKLNPFQPDKMYVKIYASGGLSINEDGFTGGKYGKFVTQGAKRMVRRYRPKE